MEEKMFLSMVVDAISSEKNAYMRIIEMKKHRNKKTGGTPWGFDLHVFFSMLRKMYEIVVELADKKEIRVNLARP
ncbi:MAG: hypothetical protein R3A45_11505 [Bdellovibrionota bacterium]